MHFYPFQNDMRSLTVGHMFSFMARDPQRISYDAEVIRRARALATFPFEFDAESPTRSYAGLRLLMLSVAFHCFDRAIFRMYVSVIFLFVIGSLFTLIK